MTYIPTNRQFVRRSLALKGGKPKAAYIAEAREKGLIATYSGKNVYDEEGNLVRSKGFYLTPVGLPMSPARKGTLK